jgi:hypothetical protein
LPLSAALIHYREKLENRSSRARRRPRAASSRHRDAARYGSRRESSSMFKYRFVEMAKPLID